MDLIVRSRKIIENYALLKQEDKILIGCSGGLDSMCLVFILHNLGFELHIAHVNYHLRAFDSDADEKLVREMATDLNLPIYVLQHRIDKTQTNLQAVARNVRRDFFERTILEHDLDKICLGHHLDDLVEGFFLHVMRSAGLKGLSGMKWVSGNYVRPLLSFTKSELVAFATDHKITWREDVTNAESHYKRNALRNTVLPKLELAFPNYRENVVTSMQHIQEAHEVLQELLEPWENKYVVDGELCIPIMQLQANKTDFYHFKQHLLSKGFSDEQIQDVVESSHQTGKRWESDEYLLFIDKESARCRKKEYVNIDAVIDLQNLEEHIILHKSHLHCSISNDPIPNTNHTVSIPIDIISDNQLAIRGCHPGEIFYPSGMEGSKTLKKFFVDEKVSTYDKMYVPILYHGDEVVWIMGYRMDRRYTSELIHSKYLNLSYLD